MVGIPDGVGAYDNGDGTFTMLINHEIGNGNGAIRAHGSRGAFVSKWIIDKATLRVNGGADLTQRVHLYNPAAGTYTAYSAASPLPAATAGNGLGRFCSGDLPAPSAFYNTATGKGTAARIMMNGEETGAEGRAFAHIATGPAAGNTYELPYLGKFSWENSVASPRMSDTTVVIGTDDATPGQVYVYIGVKRATGNDIERAGLVGGRLYGVAMDSLLESNSSVPAPGATFSLIDLGTVEATTGAALQTASNTLGVTQFLRPEDGAWDPTRLSDFYFLTTNGITSPSRLWRLRFSNPGNLTAGGTIEAVLDGTEGQKMMDNMGIDNWGHILIQEDAGNNVHIGKTWQYDIATDGFKVVLAHDSTRFLTGAADFITQDEEASGIIDVQEILGAGWFVGVDQIHKNIAATDPEAVELGQMFAFYNPDTYNSNPEIAVEGNGVVIPAGTTTTSSGTSTDFGTVPMGASLSRTFAIRNAGPAPLTVTGIGISGVHASEFSIAGAPAFPMTIAAGGRQDVEVRLTPANLGLRQAKVTVASNDFNEGSYSFAVQGVALNATSIANLGAGQPVKLYPNPTGNGATVEVTLKAQERITVSLLDLNGRAIGTPQTAVYNVGTQKIFVSTADVPAGTYFVQIEAGAVSTRMKLGVQH